MNLHEILVSHIGHNVHIRGYGPGPSEELSLQLECDDCGHAVLDADLYDLRLLS